MAKRIHRIGHRPVVVTSDPQVATVLVIAAAFDPDLNEALRAINGGSTWSRSARVLDAGQTGPPAPIDTTITGVTATGSHWNRALCVSFTTADCPP